QESTPQQSNVLLVSASYKVPDSTTEISLVLFDDGSTIDFPFEQKTSAIGEDCTVDLDTQSCSCGGAIYKIKSGDATKGDNLFTRKFAIANSNASSFLLDCIMRQKKEIPVTGNAGVRLEFKLEAIDRQGNIATWPTRLTAV